MRWRRRRSDGDGDVWEQIRAAARAGRAQRARDVFEMEMAEVMLGRRPQCDAQDEGRRCGREVGHPPMHAWFWDEEELGGPIEHYWSGAGQPPLDGRDYEVKGPAADVWGDGQLTGDEPVD